MKDKMVTRLVVEKNDYKKLKRIALEEERSISSLIREMIKELLSKKKGVNNGIF